MAIQYKNHAAVGTTSIEQISTRKAYIFAYSPRKLILVLVLALSVPAAPNVQI